MFKKLEELEVYQLAEQLADRIWDICVKWEAFARFTIGEQFVSAADSIAANISEGHGRFSVKDNIRFCYFARGSLDETRNWIRRASQRGLLTAIEAKAMGDITDTLGAKLNAYINSIRRQFREGNMRTATEQPGTKN